MESRETPEVEDSVKLKRQGSRRSSRVQDGVRRARMDAALSTDSVWRARTGVQRVQAVCGEYDGVQG